MFLLLKFQKLLTFYVKNRCFYMESPLIKRCFKSSNTNCNTYIKFTAATTAPGCGCQQIYPFTKKWKKSALNEKVCFCFFPLQYIDGYGSTAKKRTKWNCQSWIMIFENKFLFLVISFQKHIALVYFLKMYWSYMFLIA